MSRPHWSVWLGAALAGLPTLAGLGAVAFAVLSLRSPGSDGGADPGGWAVVWTLVALVSLAAAGLGAVLAAGLRRLLGGRLGRRRG